MKATVELPLAAIEVGSGIHTFPPALSSERAAGVRE